MISVEMPPFKQQSSQQSNQGRHCACTSRPLQSNRSNSTQTYPTELANREENQINLLEKSLDFLRTQHDNMLKALHDEVEQLRRTNKELQFRLVMCCCASNKGGGKKEQAPLPDNCTTNEAEKTELAQLKILLDEEKRKNAELQNQLASVIGSTTAKSDDLVNKTNEGDKNQRNLRLSTNTDEWLDQAVISKQRSSRKRSSGGKKYTELSELSKISHTRVGSGPRIASPEFNLESSSSAIILNPDTVIDTPDGFWVRPSTAALQNPPNSKPAVSPRSSRVSGHLLPVKLPVLRTSLAAPQANATDNNKETLSPLFRAADETNEEPNSKKSVNQSNEARPCRPSKSVRNIIKMYEAARNSITRSNSALPNNSSNQSNREPFLPAIVKPVDNGRSKKTRDNPPKKHTYRNSDYRHP